jgi:hypothetical protein
MYIMSNQSTPVSVLPKSIESSSNSNSDELLRLFQAGVQRAVADHLSAGHTVYYGGTGSDAGRLFLQTPDGRHFEYRMREDGTREVIREIVE